MLVLVCILINCIFRCIFYKHFIRPTYAFFIVSTGIIWCLLVQRFPNISSFAIIMNQNPAEIAYFYIPVLIFKVIVCTDIHNSLRTLPQILIISVPIFLLTSVATGFIMMQLIDVTWSYRTGFFIGCLYATTYVTHITSVLRDKTVRTTQITNLLEGEALVTNTFLTLIIKIMLIRVRVDHWEEYLMLIVCYVVLGSVSGYIIGVLASYLIRKTSAITATVVMLFIGIPITVFTLSMNTIGAGGMIATIATGMTITFERQTLSNRIEETVLFTWRSFGAATESTVALFTIIQMYYAFHDMRWKDCILVFVIYGISYIGRFASFMVHAPILSRIGSGMTFKNMLLLVIGGTKSPVSLFIVAFMYTHYEYFDEKTYRLVTFYVGGVYFLSYIINASIFGLMLRVLKFTDVTLPRQINMNNCMRHINTKRTRIIRVLKMDRTLSDCDWNIIIAATSIKHPYVLDDDAANEEYDFFGGYRHAYCDDCQIDILKEPTKKQMREMVKEAKLRILKSKKMSYSRQFENELISDECFKILRHAVEIAMETEEAVIVLDGLHSRFNEESCFRRLLKKCVKCMSPNNDKFIRPPRTYWRRLCYHIIITKKYEYFIYIVIILDMVSTILNIWYHFKTDVTKPDALVYGIFVANTIFFLIYLADFVFKVMGYSWRYICKDGLVTYFKSAWNVFDFILLCENTVHLIMECMHLKDCLQNKEDVSWSFNLVLKFLHCLRLVKLWQSCKNLRPKIVKYLEHNLNSRMAFTYELGRSYVTGEDEILGMLPYMIDHAGVREQMRKKLEKDRLGIIKLLGLVQRDKPWIAITVKTKQAIRTILCSMKNSISNLKSSGWIDDFEEGKLKYLMDDLYKNVTTMKSVEQSAPKDIFREVEWMADDDDVIDFLFENATIRKFDPGEFVFEEGRVADCIYIVVTGILVIKYTPEKSVLVALDKFGVIPIVDYISADYLREASIDYIVSGNCVGVLSFLTGRPYNCRVLADSHTQVYMLSFAALHDAMRRSHNTVDGLKARMWKAVSVRIVPPIMATLPAYYNSPYEAKYALERAFVPNLSKVKVMIINELIEDLLLIDGIVCDFSTRKVFTAPCVIPRTTHKIIFPTSSFMNLPISVESKIMIIPTVGVENCEIKFVDKVTCQMSGTYSDAKCLQHIVKERNLKAKKLKSSRRRRNVADLSIQDGLSGSFMFGDISLTSDSLSVRFEGDEGNEPITTSQNVKANNVSKK